MSYYQEKADSKDTSELGRLISQKDYSPVQVEPTQTSEDQTISPEMISKPYDVANSDPCLMADQLALTEALAYLEKLHITLEISPRVSTSLINKISETITWPFRRLQKKHQQLNSRRDDLNSVHWYWQAQAIEESTHSNALKKELAQREMLYQNLWGYGQEYWLRKDTSVTYFDVDKAAYGPGYKHQNLSRLTNNALDMAKKTGESLARTTTENQVFSFVEEWMKFAPIGEQLVVLSPPGKDKKKYPGYYFIFHYTIESESQLKRRVKLVAHKRFLKKGQAKEIFKRLKHPYQGKENELLIMKHIVRLKHNDTISEAGMQILLEPYQKNTPTRYQEKRVNQLLYEQQFNILFNEFLAPVFLESFATDLSENLVKKMDFATDLANRMMLKWLDEQEKFETTKTQSPARALDSARISLLWQQFRDYVAVKIEKTYQANHYDTARINLGWINLLGDYTGRITSVGSCLAGTGPSLMLRASQKVLPAGFNPRLFFNFRESREIICPICHVKMRGICPLCGYVDQFGLNPSILASLFMPTVNQEKVSIKTKGNQAVTIFDQSLKEELSPPPVSLTNFIAGLLSQGPILGG